MIDSESRKKEFFPEIRPDRFAPPPPPPAGAKNSSASGNSSNPRRGDFSLNLSLTATYSKIIIGLMISKKWVTIPEI